MNQDTLRETAMRLTNPPKGILAADESSPTCDARFDKLGIAKTEENRRAYRELLITAPGIDEYISGFILFDETIRQSDKSGKLFTSIMKSKGIDIGIKVDKGTKDFPPLIGDKITEGLEGLTGRLKEYRSLGATFAKWRAVYTIGENTPSQESMQENAVRLAEYAFLCQEEDIVPIVEPEVLLDGKHTIDESYEATAKNLDILFTELKSRGVYIPGLILKTSMVISGNKAAARAPAEKVAEMTVKCLREHVPTDIGGIVFLSGGQEDLEATENLNAMHKNGDLPWNLTFSYSRAIQNPVLKAWAANPSDVAGAQALLLVASRNNSLASIGEYK